MALFVVALSLLIDDIKTLSDMRPARHKKTMNVNADNTQLQSSQTLKASGSKWQYGKRGYALSQSLKQFKRYKMASIITLMVLGITLALPVILLFASSALQQLGTRSLDGESLTAYLINDVSDLQGAELAPRLRGPAQLAADARPAVLQGLALAARCRGSAQLAPGALSRWLQKAGSASGFSR